jgi:hypothetical protein
MRTMKVMDERRLMMKGGREDKWKSRVDVV